MKQILSTPNDLKQFTLIETDLLNQVSEYQENLTKCRQIFTEMLASSPQMDDRPYQYEYAALMLCRPYNIMGYAQGVGKTNTSITAVLANYDNDLSTVPPGSIQVSIPNLLAAQRWVEDGDRFISWKDNYQIIKSITDLPSLKPIWVYTHDFPKRKHKDTTIAEYLASFVKFLVIDELHELANNSKRTRSLSVVRESADNVLGLSGTLSDGNLSQVHNLNKFIYGDKWAFETASAFTRRFGSKKKLKTNYLYGSKSQEGPEKYLHQLDSKNLAAYWQLIRRFVHRVTLDEPQVASCTYKPEAKVIIHALQPSPILKKKYHEYIREHIAELRALANSTQRHRGRALSLISPLIKLCNSEIKDSPKLNKLLEIVQKSEGKVAIFCSLVSSARRVQNLLEALYPNQIVRIYAKDPLANPKELSRDKANEYISQFQYDPNIKVGIFSTNLASQSIDLTETSDLVQYCLTWSSKKLQQSITRAVRPGNRRAFVNIHYLFHEGLIDEHQTTLATKKVEVSKMVMDYYDPILMTNIDDENDFNPSDIIKKLLAG